MSAKHVAKIDSQKAASAGSEASTPIINHPKFFLDDRLVVIQIENIRFNVHKYQLIKSRTFKDLFATAEQTNCRAKPVEGSIDNPIQLEGISASDFERLLTVLYADYFSGYDLRSNASLIVPAFRLANILNFSDLRGRLQPLVYRVLGDVDKIVIAREFDIKNWLVPAYIGLCRRPTPLTADEATKLGIDSLLMICILRQEFPLKPRAASTSTCSGTYCPGCACHHASNHHCAGCNIQTKPPTAGLRNKMIRTTTIPSGLQEKLNEWVKNGCEFKVD